jgi:hypothetical protein
MLAEAEARAANGTARPQAVQARVQQQLRERAPRLRQTLAVFDARGDGALPLPEFRAALKSAGVFLSDRDARRLWDAHAPAPARSDAPDGCRMPIAPFLAAVEASARGDEGGIDFRDHPAERMHRRAAELAPPQAGSLVAASALSPGEIEGTGFGRRRSQIDICAARGRPATAPARRASPRASPRAQSPVPGAGARGARGARWSKPEEAVREAARERAAELRALFAPGPGAQCDFSGFCERLGAVGVRPPPPPPPAPLVLSGHAASLTPY